MTQDNEARLRRLLDAGKITQEEYDELRENLPEEPATAAQPPPSSPPPPMTRRTEPPTSFWSRRRPWQVWLCSIGLWLGSIISLLAAILAPILSSDSTALPTQFSGDVPPIVLLFDMLIKTALGFAIFARWKSGFIAGLVIASLTAVLGLIANNIAGALMNVVFILILSSAKSYFFPSWRGIRIAGENGSRP